MKIEFTVRLPVDSYSVPFARSVCRSALEHLRVGRQTTEEIVLALTEACANAVTHAGAGTEYELSVAIDDDTCRISVRDEGDGFDAPPPQEPLDPHTREGAGLLLMRALVDELAFVHDPDGRHRVTLEKRLTARPALRVVE